MQGLRTKSKQFKLNQLNFAIPLMAFAGLVTLGIFAINQDVNYDASASNNMAVNSTISYGDQYITISNNTSVDLSSETVVATASQVYAKDTVTVTTNVSTGYELYLTSTNSDSAALTSSTSNDTIKATSGTGGETGTPKTLDQDSYGYAVASGTIGNTKFDSSYASPTSSSKWAGVPAGTSDRLRATNTAATSGDVTEVHYGASLTNAVAPGTYTGQVTYSTVVTPTSGTYKMSVSPSTGGSGTVLTVTSGPTTINTAANLDTSEVEIYFRQSGTTKGTCTVTNVRVTSGHLVTTCTVPDVAGGTYDVVVSVPRYGFKDMKTSAFVIYDKMQGFTSTQCSNLTEATDKTVIDTRDGNTYTIRKLKDGHCWMVTNLKLGGTSAMTLYKTDTDITASSWTLPASINSDFNSVATAQMHVGTTSDCTSGNCWNSTWGNYYNWPAATAGTNPSSGDATSSICPKGWKLPLGTTADYSWYYLYNTGYGGSSNPAAFQTATNTGTSYWSGDYYSSGLYRAGSFGYWWSRTANGNNYAYSLYMYSGNVNPRYSDSHKYSGYPVRCVLSS